MVRNFSVSDYKAGLQNWSICQDSNCCIYVGNNKGLLVYDGLQWDCYALPNNEVVRVVKAIDKRIYVGSYEEFGYFERDICNVLVYTSLSKLVENYNYNQDEIWTIVSYGDEVLFQSFASYFVYNGVEVTAYQGALRPLYFFQLDSTIYVQEMNGEFYEYVHGNYIQVFKNSLKDHVVSVIKHPEGGLLLVTENSGVYHYVDNFLKVIMKSDSMVE